MKMRIETERIIPAEEVFSKIDPNLLRVIDNAIKKIDKEHTKLDRVEEKLLQEQEDLGHERWKLNRLEIKAGSVVGSDLYNLRKDFLCKGKKTQNR